MEDKRVLKTRQNLKQTLLFLLGSKTFEQITVTELCEAANTSRITFYSHYNDKYELAEDMLNDISAGISLDYERLQRKNNPQNDPMAGFENLLECILEAYCKHASQCEPTVKSKSSYLNFALYQHVMGAVENYARRVSERLKPKYTLKQMSAFIINGMMGFVNECMAQKRPFEEIKAQTKDLLRDILSAITFRPAVQMA